MKLIRAALVKTFRVDDAEYKGKVTYIEVDLSEGRVGSVNSLI